MNVTFLGINTCNFERFINLPGYFSRHYRSSLYGRVAIQLKGTLDLPAGDAVCDSKQAPSPSNPSINLTGYSAVMGITRPLGVILL